jgi:hypothetical protein
MRSKLEEIKRIPGVTSIYIVNNKAELIDGILDPTLTQDKAAKLAERIVKIYAIGIYGKVKRKSSEIELLFENGRVFSVDCDQFVLIIVCTNTVAISMVRLTTNVITKSLVSDKGLKELTLNVIDKKVLLRKDRLNEVEIALLEQI